MAIVMLATLFVPAVSAKITVDNATKDNHLEVARKLWGTDITNGEYIKQVFPEAYDESPDAATKQYYDTKMVWVDPMADSNQIVESSAKDAQAIANGITIYLVSCQGTVKKSSSSTISFSSTEKMVLPSSTTKIPQMALTTQVFRKNGDNAVLVGASYKIGTNVYTISTSGSTAYKAGYYKMIIQGSAVWPVGVEPPTWYQVKDLGWKSL